ncbi:MAG: hypothetical protein DA328_09650 [Nitrososphaeraceae archaeon]|nr:hypothetical protein [Nitrososphaeraceae archaeon]
MNLENKMIFAIISFAIVSLMFSSSENNDFQQQSFISTFAQENEAEIEAEIEQENKCKKDSECKNENELNNELSIVNETETGTGQLTVIKEVTCQTEPSNNGFTHTVLQEQPIIAKIQYVPVGPVADPCDNIEFQTQFEPQDFEFTVTGNNPSPDTFPGSSSGVVITLGAGSYDVEETDNVPSNLGPFTVNIDTTETGDCSGTISAGDSKTCTFTNDITLMFETGQ